jgi:hypothetical protein
MLFFPFGAGDVYNYTPDTEFFKGFLDNYSFRGSFVTVT